MGRLNYKFFNVILLLAFFSLLIYGCGLLVKPELVEINITWNENGQVKEKINGAWVEITKHKRAVEPDIFLQLKAFPEEGYELIEWNIVGADFGNIENLLKEEISLTNFKDKAEIAANFVEEREKYDITFREINGLSGVKIQVYRNEEMTLPATSSTLTTDINGEIMVELTDGGYWFRAALADSKFESFIGNFEVLEAPKYVDFEMVERVKKITVIRQPQLRYLPGEKLNLENLMVSLEWAGGWSEELDFENFNDNGLITVPEDRITLYEEDHDKTKVTITHPESGKNAETGELRVRNKKIIFEEYFDIPTKDDGKENEKFEVRYPDWERQGQGGGLNWNVTDSLYPYSYSGGKPFELSFNFSPIDDGVFKVITPEIDTTGYEYLEITFKQKVTPWDLSDLSFELRVVASKDDGITWEVLKILSPGKIIYPAVTTISLDEEFDEEEIKIAWIYEGDSRKVSGWFIDDIVLEGYEIK